MLDARISQTFKVVCRSSEASSHIPRFTQLQQTRSVQYAQYNQSTQHTQNPVQSAHPFRRSHQLLPNRKPAALGIPIPRLKRNESHVKPSPFLNGIVSHLQDSSSIPTNTEAPFKIATETPRPKKYPAPPEMTRYHQPIYTGTTHNPAVFLAILRIAEKNLPNVDFVSALNHIPSVGPADPDPVLTPTAPGNLAPAPFIDAERRRKKRGDNPITVAFLPYFFDNGTRHAIGFWEYITDFKRGLVMGSACVTPCSEGDLRRYGLVSYIDAEDLVGVVGEGDERVEGVDLMKEICVHKGNWLERSEKEDWEEWRGVFWTAAVHWEFRMRLMRGEREGRLWGKT